MSIKRIYFPLLVFITGACVLMLEITATRILAPFYGNTIFSVSSIICIVLFALSLGYYFGGKLSDKHPSEKLFYFLIILSGLFVLLLHILIYMFLPALGSSLSIVTGPLISSLLLFFLPSVFLGTLSPFAIKLQSSRFPELGVGTVSGEIFFFSTFGSILGSLLTGFVLIPLIGVNELIFALGVLLLLLGFIPLTVKKSLSLKVTIIILIVLTSSLSSEYFYNASYIYRKDGLYETLFIYDGLDNGKQTRFFRQDRSSSGAMYLNSSEHVYPYTKYYSLYKIFNPNVRNSLVIGGGIYTVPKSLLNENSEILVDVAEIEPSLIELSEKYFNLKKSNRLTNYVEDGRRLLFASDKSYDLIFSDAYHSLFSIPTHLTTVEFFDLAYRKLNDNGVFIGNFIGDLSQGSPSFIFSEIKTFKEAFPNSYFLAVDSVEFSGAQNIIFVGYKGSNIVDFQKYSTQFIDVSNHDFSKEILLTDNYAPVEFLYSGLLRKNFSRK